VTYGDVSFDCECRNGQRRDVHTQELTEDHQGAPSRPEERHQGLVNDEEVLYDGREGGGDEQEDIGHGEGHEVAVGRSAHAPRARNNEHDHDVTKHTDQEDYLKNKCVESQENRTVGWGFVFGVGICRRAI